MHVSIVIARGLVGYGRGVACECFLFWLWVAMAWARGVRLGGLREELGLLLFLWEAFLAAAQLTREACVPLCVRRGRGVPRTQVACVGPRSLGEAE